MRTKNLYFRGGDSTVTIVGISGQESILLFFSFSHVLQSQSARVRKFYTVRSVEIAYVIETLEDHPKQPERYVVPRNQSQSVGLYRYSCTRNEK